MITKLWRRASRQAPNDEGSQPKEIDGAETGTLHSARYINREISDLQFIERVLEEARNERHPLLERLRFLAISSSVLDQFYSVRVARLKHAAQKHDAYITPDGMTPMQQLRAVTRRGTELMLDQQETWDHLHESLEAIGIQLLETDQLSLEDLTRLHHYFRSHILPVLTPCTIDEEHPFPFVASGDVCAILEFSYRHILVPLPTNLSRFIALPGEENRFILLENLLFRFWPDLLSHDSLTSYGVFQILRDNVLARQERSDDLRAMIESGLRMRHKANTILLKVADTISESAVRFIAVQLDILADEDLTFFSERRLPVSDSKYIYVTPMPGLASLSDMLTPDIVNDYRKHLFEPFTPRYPAQLKEAGDDCFAAIAKQDLLVHWPYESFASVVRFLEQAAQDPNVIAIKQTLYRTSDDSPVVEALIRAARDGKAVTTVIELEARENESSNVELAKRLESAGVQIIYGIVGLKIHCKATLVVRREDDDTVAYAHFSTGNYHPVNARLYTDLSYFTSDPHLVSDAIAVFNYITSGNLLPTRKLIVAPVQLRETLNRLIDNEVTEAQAGRPAHIRIKVNSLTDPDLTERLYRASQAGVEIDLVVRRHCSLRPGIDGLSSRIRVKSIVGRFLEHSRIYIFANGSDTKVYFGSADMMERNLDERVEILVPVEDPALKSRIVDEIMDANLRDTAQSWLLEPDNLYHRHPDRDGFCAHTFLLTI